MYKELIEVIVKMKRKKSRGGGAGVRSGFGSWSRVAMLGVVGSG